MIIIASMFVVHCLLDSARLSGREWASSLIGALVGQGRQLGHERVIVCCDYLSRCTAMIGRCDRRGWIQSTARG